MPVLGRAREMAVLRSRFRIEGFWKIEEPEIARAFEGRDFAFFEVEPTGDQEFKIVRQVQDRTGNSDEHGAQFEIFVNGVPRTHRDVRMTTIEAALYHKKRLPTEEVPLRDLRATARW